MLLLCIMTSNFICRLKLDESIEIHHVYDVSNIKGGPFCSVLAVGLIFINTG